ncbi:MAG: hypothetical protein WDO13_01960 [Verrucomicrobiota bacterium]
MYRNNWPLLALADSAPWRPRTCATRPRISARPRTRSVVYGAALICYAFPLAHEAELLLKHCTGREAFPLDGLHCTLGNLGGREILVARIGMGDRRSQRSTPRRSSSTSGSRPSSLPATAARWCRR